MPTLYGVGLSPFVRKVRVVLAEKRIPYDHDPVMPSNPDPEYRKMSPLGKVPAFRDGNHAFSDSSVICQYLFQRGVGVLLEPERPSELVGVPGVQRRLRVQALEVFGPKVFLPRIVEKEFMGKEPDEAAIQKVIDEQLPPRFDYLESQLGNGPYLVGKQLTIGDVAVASMFVTLFHAGEGVDPKPGKDFPARTAFEASLPHPDFLLEIECVAEA
jgi:glutathione S-transferase